MPFKDLRNQRQQIRTHHLGAGGPGIDMAVGTTLVAAVAEIDLQRCELSALQGRENGLNNSHRLHADEADSSRQITEARTAWRLTPFIPMGFGSLRSEKPPQKPPQL